MARESGKTRFVEGQGREIVSALTHAKVSCWKESFHAAAAARAGGERSWISAAVSLSMTNIGPPHLGQSRGMLGSLGGKSPPSDCCGQPSKGKESGNRVARRRLARKPKLRMRTKAFGSTCKRKRRRNLSTVRVSNFCSLW